MKKKIQFPKIKKHLHNFLTDESGKISKHNALGFGAVGALIGLVDGAEAHHCFENSLGGSTNDTWAGGTGGTYYSADGVCGHASSIWNDGPRTQYSAISGGRQVTRGMNLGSSGLSDLRDYTCSIGAGLRSVGADETFYRNCGGFSANIRGHMSNIGRFSDARDTTTHSNRHNNY